MKWLYALVITCGCTVAAHGSSFSVTADKPELTLGQSFVLTLRADNAATSLKQLPIDILRKDFSVASTDIQQQGKSQFMSLRLYPLKAGPITIPSLSFAGLRSKALNLMILESSADISSVSVKTGFTSSNFVERQAAYLVIDVDHDGGLQWQPPQVPTTPDAHIRALPPLPLTTNSDGTVKQRYAYTLMPLRSGIIKISWPLLEASKFGEPLRYAIPATILDVSPIPRYLPLHVPVGKVTVLASKSPATVTINQPFNWEFIIQGTGLSDEGLSKLLDVPESNTLKIYPAQIEVRENGTAAIQTAKFTVSLVPLKAGAVSLPKITLPYYDPQLGRIEGATVPHSGVRVFDPVTQWLWWVAASLAICLGLGLILWKIVAYCRELLAKRAWLKQLAAAQDVKTLRHALLAPTYRGTMKQWMERYQQQFGANAALQHQIERLHRISFSPAARDNFSQLRQTLIFTLRNRPKKCTPEKTAALDFFELMKPPASSQ